MGQVTIKVSAEEAAKNGNVGLLISNPFWFREHGLDWQRPVYITPDKGARFYYIDAWELEDVNLETS